MGIKITIISVTASAVTVLKNGFKDYNYTSNSIGSFGKEIIDIKWEFFSPNSIDSFGKAVRIKITIIPVTASAFSVKKLLSKLQLYE